MCFWRSQCRRRFAFHRGGQVRTSRRSVIRCHLFSARERRDLVLSRSPEFYPTSTSPLRTPPRSAPGRERWSPATRAIALEAEAVSHLLDDERFLGVVFLVLIGFSRRRCRQRAWKSTFRLLCQAANPKAGNEKNEKNQTTHKGYLSLGVCTVTGDAAQGEGVSTGSRCPARGPNPARPGDIIIVLCHKQPGLQTLARSVVLGELLPLHRLSPLSLGSGLHTVLSPVTAKPAVYLTAEWSRLPELLLIRLPDFAVLRLLLLRMPFR